MTRLRFLVALSVALAAGAPRTHAQIPAADFTILGEGADDDLGWEVAPAGDVNGDGVADLIVGAPSNDAVAGFAGRAYIFHGPFTGNLRAADAAAIVSAEAFGDNLGFSVAAAGDVNGDGTGDVLIGARSNDTRGTQAGRVYVFFGPLSGDVAATSADAIISGAAFNEIGRSVAPLGDLNGDGYADVVVGSDIAGPGFAGQAFVFYGPLAGERTAASADAIITGSFANESFGASVASAGDVNGDGRPDLIVGAPRFPLNGQGTGRAYLFYGTVQGNISALDADAILFGERLNDGFGTSAASAGDVNADGYADVIVGADQLFGAGPGKAYVFLGPLNGAVQAAEADAILSGESPADLFGASVSGAGDFNGDGFSDVIVGAWDNDAGGGRSGRAYVFHGPVIGSVSAANADFTITGRSGDQSGSSVASAGDLDGDGVGDVIVGAPQFTEGAAGYAVVYFGRETVAGLSLRAAPLNPPPVIPAEGGGIRYQLTLTSIGDAPQTVDFWTTLTGPGPARLFGPVTLTLEPGLGFNRILTLTLPADAPPGTYVITFRAGTFPQAGVADSFSVEKLATATTRGRNGERDY